MPLKVHLRLRFPNLGKPRTAGLCGWAAGACDCGPLSCAKIERPSPLKKPSCKVRFFAQNRSRKYRQKVTAITMFQTAFHRVFQLFSQTPYVCFHGRKWVHTRLSEKDRTQRPTRRNTGLPDGGAIITLDTSCTFTNIPGPGVRTANFAAFEPWPEVLSKNAESLRDSDALMRVAVPQASRPRWAALLCLQFGDVAVFSLCAQGFPHMQKRVWYHYPRRAPRVVETLGGRLSKQFICRFLRLGSLH